MTAFARPAGPRSLAARRAAATAGETVLRGVLAEDGARLLLLVPDPHARFAAVELAAPFAASVLEDGYGVCSYVFAWTPSRDPLPASGVLGGYLEGFGDLRVRPDAASAIPLGDRTWAVVGDAEWPSGAAAELAPREVLRGQLAALEGLGLVPSVGIEHEVVFRDSLGAPLTAHGVDYALGGTERLAPLLRDLRTDLAEAGLGVESARAECHPGQYEIVLRHRDALAACDDVLLQQLIVRRAAARHGVTADYLAAPSVGQGNSGHVHLSLSAVDGSEPDLLGGFLAGVLRDARALTAVWAPTWNSYVRLRTAPFSPREVRWGHDDRTAAVRVAGAADNRRLEFRFAGADAQPHLVVAALLAAGRFGLEEGLVAPEAGVSAGALAGSPWEALSLLERVGELLGVDVAAQLSALLTEEIESGLESVTDWQRLRGSLRS
ncbi:glutamine synthetase-like protein [Amycolatopsis mediterranei S699]|uniref:Glutamine synthetase-like protein n=2 Tax=Amycolatopsis mediterranei TaxID=33910 RepID=A0A0H3D1G9_AMYMU|nr:glutamine synthetase [Amycolatopsis mediterranei]ADJ44490.1 glutamine synthetase-like protein [Amycolatopsis mediterranei U32]AEK41228.1 glutamine synthetase-like protein [Amycolatopsis mediterranei S699]AFO76203.1 glutamine synthetase-like protein [Amycolatopsis mediterranei S699]AGT83332.1 glutamine synthetase-like protein [Amycolatopsis mediterranei RB]KDO07153.1 glutamine synthetase [Amycolatopsis mediterranei]